MPSFAPRQQPVRKKQQLSQREMELATAIRKNFTDEKLLKFLDKFRDARLPMIKAKIHFLHEQEFQKKLTSLKLEKLNSEIIEWTNKSNELIVSEIRSEFID